MSNQSSPDITRAHIEDLLARPIVKTLLSQCDGADLGDLPTSEEGCPG